MPLDTLVHLRPFRPRPLQGYLYFVDRLEERTGELCVAPSLHLLLDSYERYRRWGVHDGPPLIGIRAQLREWQVQPDAANTDTPDSADTLCSLMRPRPELWDALVEEARTGERRAPDPVEVEAGDRVLAAGEARVQGAVRVVDDPAASGGRALHFPAGAVGVAEFTVQVEQGRLRVWLRGKGTGDPGVDSCTLEVVVPGSNQRAAGEVGRWSEAFPADAFAWSSRSPGWSTLEVEVPQNGELRLRLKPGEATCFLDQVWLSRGQEHAPAFAAPVRGPSP